MYPKKNRITKTKEINSLLRFGRKINTINFTISYSPIISTVKKETSVVNKNILANYDKFGNFIINESTLRPFLLLALTKIENLPPPLCI